MKRKITFKISKNLKLFAMICVFAMCIFSASTLANNGYVDVPEHEHTPKENLWGRNDTAHWRFCSYPGCMELVDYEEHIFNINGVCIVCFYDSKKSITSSVDGGHGTIIPDGETKVMPGESQTFTFNPSTYYTIKSLLIDSTEQTITGASRQALMTNGYSFSNVTTAHTIAVTYGLDYDGNYIPDDEENNEGYTPDDEIIQYELCETIRVDLTPPSITNVAATVTGVNTYEVTATVADPNLVDGKPGSQENASLRRYILTNSSTAPDVDDANWQVSNTFTTSETQNLYFWVMAVDNVGNVGMAYGLAQIDYTISASVNGGHGSIAPSGSTSVSPGQNQTYTFSANSGYTIKSLLIDGNEATTPSLSRATLLSSGYTFVEVAADHTIVVRYGVDENGNNIPDDEEYLTITSTAGSNGTVAPLGETSVLLHGSQSFTITPNSLYTIKYLKVDGVEQTSRGNSRQSFVQNGYTFTNVVDNHTILVTFGEDNDSNYIPDDEEGDEFPPEGTISIRNTVAILDGTRGINTGNVILDISAVDDTSASGDIQMALINEDEVVVNIDLTSKWSNYATQKNWTLSNGDGRKTVYLVLKDARGNISVIPTP